MIATAPVIPLKIHYQIKLWLIEDPEEESEDELEEMVTGLDGLFVYDPFDDEWLDKFEELEGMEVI